MAIVYVSGNAFVLVLSFFPSDAQEGVDRKHQILSALIQPIAGHCVLALGILWWVFDLYILPSLGYKFEIEEVKVYSDRWAAQVLDVRFVVSLSNLLSLTRRWLMVNLL